MAPSRRAKNGTDSSQSGSSPQSLHLRWQTPGCWQGSHEEIQRLRVPPLPSKGSLLLFDHLPQWWQLQEPSTRLVCNVYQGKDDSVKQNEK